MFLSLFVVIVTVPFHYIELVPLLVQTQAASERFVDEVERRWGVRFPEGRNPDLSFMAHLWEPLRSVALPFLIELILTRLAELGTFKSTA